MRKAILMTLVSVATLIIAIGAGMFVVGAPLCGPICLSTGPQHWSKTCLGYVWRQNVIDSYTDYCIGIPIGSRHCFTGATSSNGTSALVERRCDNFAG